MLRRAGAFAPPLNSTIFWPERNDSDNVIESKWRKWAERESFKRCLMTVACKILSYAEMP